MKVWVGLSVLCLVWSASFEMPAWKTYLEAVDSDLPYITPTDGKICYRFDITQPCSSDAISTLLGLPAATDIPNWTPSLTDCNALLDGQRAYAENVATSLFASSITSARTAGVTDYELMLQSWVLRVGYYQLARDHAAFRAVLNGVADWTSVKCDGANLLHDETTTDLPPFVGTKDCDVLSFLFPAAGPCDSAACSTSEAESCLTNTQSPCYLQYSDTVCQIDQCAGDFYRICCLINCGSPCCDGSPAANQFCR